MTRAVLVFVLALSACSALLPEEAREQVRRNQPEVVSDYSRDGPATKSDPAVIRLREVVYEGMSLDLLYDRCGEPDSTSSMGTKVIYDTCDGSIGFEAEIRRARISSIWY